MKTDYILAIDQGTTGSTCLLVDSQHNIAATATREFPQFFPRPGLVEHDPGQIWDSVCQAIADVLSRGGVSPREIGAIGITNQRETSILWDRQSGEPVHPAIVWQDRRTADECRRLTREGNGERVRELTGLLLDPYFSATKIAWMLHNVDGARSRALSGQIAFGTVDSFLIWKLTGGLVHATDPSNASRTMLWPLSCDGWSGELCEIFGVPAEILPQVLSCTGDFGSTRGVPGLPDGIPIRGVVGDQQSALFAQACLTPGDSKCTFGTGAFAMLTTGGRQVQSSSGLVTTVGWDLGDGITYCLEGSCFMAGGLVQWLRDGLKLIHSAGEIEALAQSVPDSGGVVIVPAHVGLGAPHWKPDARGSITGLTRGSTAGHIARAALEGIAHQVTDLLQAMGADMGAPVGTLKVDGGASRNDLLMQIQADLLGTKLERPAALESTGMGAVYMAGLGIGMWSSTDEIAAAREIDREFVPRSSPEIVSQMRAAWKEAVGKI